MLNLRYTKNMTRSEQLLEEILQRYGITFTKIPESKVDGEKRPDYLVGSEHSPTYWEVKELEENPVEKKIIEAANNSLSEVYSIDSERLAGKLEAAFKQFESYKVTHHPCVIVLYDARSFFTHDLLFEQKITSYIIGHGHYMENEDGKLHEIYRTKSILYRKKHYISGLVNIRRNNEIAFYHNPHTQNSLHGHNLLKSIPIQYVASKMKKGLVWVQSQM